jgi:hypothetical protein
VLIWIEYGNLVACMVGKIYRTLLVKIQSHQDSCLHALTQQPMEQPAAAHGRQLFANTTTIARLGCSVSCCGYRHH